MGGGDQGGLAPEHCQDLTSPRRAGSPHPRPLTSGQVGGAASVLGGQRFGWPGSVPCSSEPRQGPRPPWATQRLWASDPQAPLNLEGGLPPGSRPIPLRRAGAGGCHPVPGQTAKAAWTLGRPEVGAPLAQAPRWGGLEQSETHGQASPVSPRPCVQASGSSPTEQRQGGIHQASLPPPACPHQDMPSGLRPSVTQLSVHASSALRLMPPHPALSTEGGPPKL